MYDTQLQLWSAPCITHEDLDGDAYLLYVLQIFTCSPFVKLCVCPASVPVSSFVLFSVANQHSLGSALSLLKHRYCGQENHAYRY